MNQGFKSIQQVLTAEQIEQLQQMDLDKLKRALGIVTPSMMFEEKPVVCRCKDCDDERAALQAQLDHPFYQRVDDFRDEVKAQTMEKAAKKYKEPFNPLNWTIRELGWHGMAENYDQGNYIVGLVEKAEAIEAAYNNLLKDYEAQAKQYEKQAEELEQYKRMFRESYQLNKSRNVVIGEKLNEIARLEYELKASRLEYKIATSGGQKQLAYQKELIDHIKSKPVIDKRV